MNNREFDSFIKTRLKEAGHKGVPNWNEMEDQIRKWELQEGLISDQDFDHLVKDRLAHLKAAEGSRNWPKLENRIFSKNKVYKTIFYYQVAGVAVVILLLLLLFQIKPSGSDAFKPDVIAKNGPGLQAPGMELENTSDNTVFMPSEDHNIIIKPTGQNTAEVGQGKQSEKTDGIIVYKPNAISTQDPAGKESSNEKGDVPSLEMVTPSESLSPNESKKAITEHFDPIVDAPVMGQKKLRKSIALSGLPNKKYELTSEQTPFDGGLWLVSYLPKTRQTKKHENGFSLYGFTTPQLSMIISPTDHLLQAPGYFRNEFNLGLGMGINYRVGNSAIDMGFAYDQLNYSPRITPEYFSVDRSQIYLSGISTQLLTIPVHFKYSYQVKNNLFVYGLTGISLLLPLHTEYAIAVKENNGLAYLIDELVSHPTYQNSLVSQKDFEKGILDGAEMDKALCINVDLGAGLEYCFGNNYSIFLEPTFSYFLNEEGFGPNHDKIHRLTFRTGVVGMLN
jgi:hypothetical protein